MVSISILKGVGFLRKLYAMNWIDYQFHSGYALMPVCVWYICKSDNVFGRPLFLSD